MIKLNNCSWHINLMSFFMGSYDFSLSLVSNMAFSCSIRFDLIFLMLDPQDEAYDRRLAHHLVSLYYQSEEQMEEEFLDMALLKDYIAYARTYINPRLSEEASQALIEVCWKTSKHLLALRVKQFGISWPFACWSSGLRGHEEDRQWSRHGVRLPPTAGVPDPPGRGPC